MGAIPLDLGLVDVVEDIAFAGLRVAEYPLRDMTPVVAALDTWVQNSDSRHLSRAAKYPLVEDQNLMRRLLERPLGTCLIDLRDRRTGLNHIVYDLVVVDCHRMQG